MCITESVCYAAKINSVVNQLYFNKILKMTSAVDMSIYSQILVSKYRSLNKGPRRPWRIGAGKMRVPGNREPLHRGRNK